MLLIQKPRFLIYLIALFLPIQVGLYVEQALGITFSAQVILGLFLLLVVALKLLESQYVKPIPLFGFWFVFVSLSAIAFIRSPSITNPIQGVWVIFRLAIVNALIYPAYWWFLNNPKKIRIFFAILSASAALSGIIAVIQTISSGSLLSGVFTNHRFLGFLFPFPPEVSQENISVLQSHFWINDIFRGHGMFYRANGFGSFMSVVIGLSWGLFRSSRRKMRIMFFVFLIVQIAGVMVSYSRTAWVAVVSSVVLAICLEAFFGDQRKQFLRFLRMFLYIIVFIFLLIIALLQFPSIADRFSTVLRFEDVGEVSWRINIWKEAFQTIIIHPLLGTGDQIVTMIPVGGNEVGFGAHNLFVGIAYETGIPSLIIFLVFEVYLLIASWKGFRYSSDYQDKMISLGIFVGFISFNIVGIGTAIFDIENIIVLFWFLLAAAINLEQQLKNKMVSEKIDSDLLKL